MKKKLFLSVVIIFVFLCISLIRPAMAEGGAGPAVLSVFFPGVGEWMNSGFAGGFPVAECCIGSICFPFMISSAVDAAVGKTDSETRFDFWSSPNK